MTSAMAFAISAPTSSLLHSSSSSSSSSAAGRISSLCLFSSSAIAIPRNAIFHNVKCIPQLGFTPFAQWSGLKSMGISISRYPVKIEGKGKWKGKVYASLFGVGAPEVLVIGVVALLVFGPKGLAEVARNMGQTIRAFQPTIKELQEVSREFKSTLEREIGLDDEPVHKKSSADTTEGLKTEPDVPPLENVDPASQARANWLKGALDQLKKEQEEEERLKEESAQPQNEEERLKEESAQPQNEEELQTPSPAADTPQAVSDIPQETSTVAPPSENPSHDSLQEPVSVASTDAQTPKLEAEI